MRRSVWAIGGLLVVSVVVFVVFRQPLVNWTKAKFELGDPVGEQPTAGPQPSGTGYAAPWPTRPDEWTPEQRTPTTSPAANPPESRTPQSPLDRSQP